jgi:putative chitinase
VARASGVAASSVCQRSSSALRAASPQAASACSRASVLAGLSSFGVPLLVTIQTPTNPRAGAGSNQTLDALVAGCNRSCPRCHAKITSEQLRRIFPSAPDDRVTIVRDNFNQYMEPLEIIRCLRKAHLFAQIRGESGNALNPVSENLAYSRRRLLEVFGQNVESRRPGVLAAADSGSQQAIGNALYANMNGNGNVASGDGYNYRGRGYIQITGRGTYSGVQGVINSKCAGSGIDVVADPDSASTPKGGIISAMAYWYWKTPSLNRTADQGDTNGTVDAITRRVRGGSHPTIDAERRTAYATTMVVFRTPECVDRDKPSSEAVPYTQGDAIPNTSANIG